VTATALSTALNMSYLAERLAIFGVVVGIALLLTGIGLVILAVAVFGRRGAAGGVSSSSMASATPS
jgi:multisubunit Na+/H+ antiporter MnhC subunit